MKMFYILTILRFEIHLIMHEDRTALEIDDIRKYMLFTVYIYCILLYILLYFTVCFTVFYCNFYCIVLCILQYFTVYFTVFYCIIYCIVVYFTAYFTVLYCIFYSILLYSTTPRYRIATNLKTPIFYYVQLLLYKAFRHVETLFVQGRNLVSSRPAIGWLEFVGRIKFVHVERPYF